MRVWGLVPARGGSKSIAKKNLLRLCGRPLLEYGVRAAQASGRLERIVCSTDDEAIADCASGLGIEVARRPSRLATDEARVDAVAQEFLQTQDGHPLPDAVVLIQPTSPFLLPRHVGELVEALRGNSEAESAHNVIEVSHNQHAWNQRRVGTSGEVKFLFAAERGSARNKQEKPELYAFGNLIMARTPSLMRGAGFYAEPSIAVPIDTLHGFDLDTLEDVRVAEALLAAGAVNLPHLGTAPQQSKNGP